MRLLGSKTDKHGGKCRATADINRIELPMALGLGVGCRASGQRAETL
jgi:hypothetical protein